MKIILTVFCIIASAFLADFAAGSQLIPTTDPNIKLMVVTQNIGKATCGCKVVLVLGVQTESPGVCYEPQTNQTCPDVGCSVTYQVIDSRNGASKNWAVTSVKVCKSDSCNPIPSTVNSTTVPATPPACSVSVLDIQTQQAKTYNGQCLNQRGPNNSNICGCTASIQFGISNIILNSIVFFTPCNS